MKRAAGRGEGISWKWSSWSSVDTRAYPMCMPGLVRRGRSAPPSPCATAFCNTHDRGKSRASSRRPLCGKRDPFRYTTQPETLTQQGLSGHRAHRTEKGPSLPCSRRSRTSWALLSCWEAHAYAAGSCCPPRCVEGCPLASRGGRSHPRRMQDTVGRWRHGRHTECQMEASEQEKGPGDQAEFDQFWIGEVAPHLRHTRPIQRAGRCGQPGCKPQGRVRLGGARHCARQLRAERLRECLSLLQRLAGVLSPGAGVQCCDVQTDQRFQRKG